MSKPTDQSPKESVGLTLAWRDDQVHDLTPELNDESLRLVEGFRPTRHELEVIARHHMDNALGYSFAYEIYGDNVWDPEEIFSNRRLGTIFEILGEEAIEKAVAPTRKKWADRFAESKSWPWCETCGYPFAPEEHDSDECYRLRWAGNK